MTDPVNPYIAGNPVTGEAMFFGREDVFAFVRQALTGRHRDNVIVLYGQRRTGKTSTLYQMRRHLDERYLCLYVDLHGLALNGIEGFLWDLANTITRALRKEYHIEPPQLNRPEFMQDARAVFENEFLPQVWNVIGDRHILLMLDEAIRLQEQVEAGRMDRGVFEYLRHLIQHSNRLNFLFALGSGLEDMEKEYAFLFSVGLYKKISFLTRDAATALITQPVKDLYVIEPSAVDHIFNITSGHPYFTQLLCHSLFNRWLQHRRALIRVDDVNETLDEVVERGLAVLKQVWEDSAPGERAVMAALASASGKRGHPVGSAEIDRMWAQYHVTLPDRERINAIRSLIVRDVIVGEDKYQFAVELQRLWIQKYERLEWVKEEIAPVSGTWQLPPEKLIEQQQVKRARTDRLAVAVILGVIVALILFMYQGVRSLAENYDRERTYRRMLEVQVTRIAEAAATGTAASSAPAATATDAAVQLRLEQQTAAVMAQRCEVPSDLADDLLKRINALRAANDLVELQSAAQLASEAQRFSGERAAGRTPEIEPDSLVYQGCQTDEVWDALSTGAVSRQMLLDSRYAWLGIGVTPGTLNTFVLKFGALPPTATPTFTPAPTSTNTLRPTRRLLTLTPTPTLTPTLRSELNLDWSLEYEGVNPSNPGEWLIVADLVGSGGDGAYQYYHDSLPVSGPRVEVVFQTCRNKPGSFWVQDGTGEIVKKKYYFFAPHCPGRPS